MNEQTVKAVTEELAEELEGARFGRVFTLSKRTFAIDMRLRNGRFLFVSVEPRAPRIYLIERRMKDLEKASRQDPPFVQNLRKRLANSEIQSVEKPFQDRIVYLRLLAIDEVRGQVVYTLVFQLTGRSANLFLLDDRSRIIDSLNPGNGVGQETGGAYAPPQPPPGHSDARGSLETAEGRSISEALDRHYTELDEAQRRESRFRSAEASLKKDLKKQRRLVKALQKDLEDHGDENRWKRLGELLLANTSTASRTEDGFVVTDYYEDDAPEIVIEADARHTVAEAAERYFRKYAKARNARSAIAERLEAVDKDIARTERELEELRKAYVAGERMPETDKSDGAGKKWKAGKKDETLQGVRKFVSSDGYEILVGRRSKDNDTLTFRIARSLDTWMHAADYPGSHVVVRNRDRKDIPQSTLVDAARIAAFYSKAKGEAKAAVHYTLRKFVHKPKGAKPGLVSLSDFKTIMVEPGIPDGVEN